MSQYEQYLEERAEARACGQEFPTFDEWTGDVDPRVAAEERIREIYDRDEQDLY